MFILCSELSLGTAPVTFLPQQLPLAGTTKLAMSSGGAWEAAQFPPQLGKDLGKIPARCITMDFVTQKENGWLLTLQAESSAGVLLNQVRSMVGGKDLQFVAIVEVAPLSPIYFTRKERCSPSTGRSFTGAESPGGDFFAERLSQIAFFSLLQLSSMWFPLCSCLSPDILNILIKLGCPIK